MIFATIGMNDSPYGEMFRILDGIAKASGEEAVFQVGNIDYVSDYAETFAFLPDEEIQKVFDRADLIVCHSGIGSILNGLNRNIPMVLVPRNVVDPNVTTDDQQAIVARKVESLGRAVVCEDLSLLPQKVEEARNLKFPPYEKNRELTDFLSELFAGIADGSVKRKRRFRITSGSGRAPWT
ncbi:hypothetical protein TALC_01562 [Thermoplasmatales archaeon BRNA1]|nr:hypothetical protein TALC_01562 [Thermoplasmatales archaeon BRNA1]